jgi:hypothetical protein
VLEPTATNPELVPCA